MKETIELQPDAVRMVEGLRDTGYQFNTAVADIVDNSISAEATHIKIDLTMNLRGEISLSIIDDGIGMDREGLINAMKYGSKQRPSAASLGKFGLGLKTASTAFCRKLSLISRADKKAVFLGATWDLDKINDLKKWALEIGEPDKKHQESLEKIIGSHRGTMVVWEKVDRLLRSDWCQNGGTRAKKAFERIEDNLRAHLGMVFQRFIDKDDKRTLNVDMVLNGKPVQAWDPFCKSESKVVSQDNRDVELPSGKKSKFSMKAYILPRKEEFATEDSFKQARINTLNQGIYIYRENRLIHGPDWLKMFSKEPHGNLLRVDFSFDHKLDEAFQVDIKKSQIILNEDLYDHVLDFLTPPRRAAEDVYRKGTKAKASEASKGAHDSSNRNISSKENEIPKPEIKTVGTKNTETQIVNSQGTVNLKLKIVNAAKPNEVYVQAVDNIDDGLLWEPCAIDKHLGVRINTGHPYYHKVYMPNLAAGVTIQGMDALLWGLSVAELSCISEATKNSFADLRYEVSRTLRKLVEDLPDPEIAE